MIKWLSASLIRALSWSFRSLGWRACRFYPTCSDYACQALGRFPWLAALKLSAARFLRCNPLSAGGFDPLPNKEI